VCSPQEAEGLVNRFSRRKLIALSSAAVLVLGLLPAQLALAAPAAPQILKSDQVDQVGLWNPASSLYAAGWVSVSIHNPGTSAYTQIRLVVKPTAGAALEALAALDPAYSNPVSSPLCEIVDNAFHCVWPSSLGGGQTTAPIRFVFGGTEFSSAECLGATPPATCDNVIASVTTKDSTNTGGSNRDDRDATTDRLLAIKIDSKTEERTNFSPPNTAITLNTWKGGGQRSSISLPASANGYLASLKELSSDSGAGPLGGCDLGGTIGNLVQSSVNQGVRVYPYLEWTMTLTMPTSEAPANGVSSVIHCVPNPAFDPSLAVGAGNQPYLTQEITTICPKDGLWSSDPAWNGCIVSIKTSVSGKNKETTTYTIKARTPTNCCLKPKAG
jgi:hypothetical protein